MKARPQSRHLSPKLEGTRNSLQHPSAYARIHVHRHMLIRINECMHACMHAYISKVVSLFYTRCPKNRSKALKHRGGPCTSQRLQYPLIKQYALNHKVYSLIKGYWSLWVPDPELADSEP